MVNRENSFLKKFLQDNSVNIQWLLADINYYHWKHYKGSPWIFRKGWECPGSSWEAQFYSFQFVPYMTTRVIFFKYISWVPYPIPIQKHNVQLKQKECPLEPGEGVRSGVITIRVAGVGKEESAPRHIFKRQFSGFSNPVKFKFQRNRTFMGTLGILFLALWFSWLCVVHAQVIQSQLPRGQRSPPPTNPPSYFGFMCRGCLWKCLLWCELLDKMLTAIFPLWNILGTILSLQTPCTR